MSELTWDKKEEQEKFMHLWDDRRHTKLDHSADAWNARAREWDHDYKENAAYRSRNKRRVDETLAYLKGRGVLDPEGEVIDIGCGPGHFVTEFAKAAKQVTGVDISSEMAQIGRRDSKENGLDNTAFVTCDFRETDIDQMGWRKNFDLVFTSVTPAVSRAEDLDKIEAMSRAYCFSSNFVRAYDAMAQEAVSYALPGVIRHGLWDGRVFYAMFNLLWLRGRFPECRYYYERSDDLIPVTRELAVRALRTIPEEMVTDTVIDKTWQYLSEHADENGCVLYPRESLYGWLLWDVRDQEERNYKKGLL